MITKGILYLIPSTLGDTTAEMVLPSHISTIINTIDEYIVEDPKSARNFLKRAGINIPFNRIIMHPLNKHSNTTEIISYLNSAETGKNIGLISDAGCPCIADPGADMVAIAHRKNIRVVPLVGPSSILLALMASGFNGQNFTFHGYLPKEKNDRIRKLKELEKHTQEKNQTQLFIETPFRNQHLLQDIINTCKTETRLCIACDLTLPTEYIKTKSIYDWKKSDLPDINKRPAIFLLYQ